MEIKPCRGRPKGILANNVPYARALGTAIKHLRNLRGTSQEELAIAANIERSHMGKIERGEHLPSIPLLVNIAIALDQQTVDIIKAMEEILVERGKT